mgnify:CR=1 FL=1
MADDTQSVRSLEYIADCSDGKSEQDDEEIVTLTDRQIITLSVEELESAILQYADLVKKLRAEKRKRTTKEKKESVAIASADIAVDSSSDDTKNKSTSNRKKIVSDCVAARVDMMTVLTNHGVDFNNNDKKDVLLGKINDCGWVDEANSVFRERRTNKESS